MEKKFRTFSRRRFKFLMTAIIKNGSGFRDEKIFKRVTDGLNL